LEPSSGTDGADGAESLVFKGVVFNEMKGTLSDPDTFFGYRTKELMFPGTAYGNSSAGEPEHIPDLTWPDLKEFHRVHYHPSNCLFFSYGDLPLAEQLERVEEVVMPHFERLSAPDTAAAAAAAATGPARTATHGNHGTGLKLRERWTEPQTIRFAGPPDAIVADPDRQTRLCKLFATNDAFDQDECLRMQILSSLLLSGPASPMYKSLLSGGIGAEYGSGTGYNSGQRDTTFGVGLIGVGNDDASIAAADKAIMDTLHLAAKEGFNPLSIEAVLHQFEISLKHVKVNFGMSVMSASSSIWGIGGDPVAGIPVQGRIDRFKKELAEAPDGGRHMFRSLIEKYLLNNPHCLSLVMDSEDSFAQSLEDKEFGSLRAKEKTLNSEDLEAIRVAAQKLEDEQNQEEDVSCLPTLTMDDISSAAVPYAINKVMLNGTVPTDYVPQPTNGLVYIRTKFDIAALPIKYYPFLSLYCALLPQVGSNEKTPQDLAVELERHVGRLGASASVIPTMDGRTEHNIGVSVRSLTHKVPVALELFQDMLLSADFTRPENKAHVRSIIVRKASEASALADSCHEIANNLSYMQLNGGSAVHGEVLGGFHQIEFIQDLMKTVVNDDAALDALCDFFQTLGPQIFTSDAMKVSYVAEESARGLVETTLSGVIQRLPSSSPSNVAAEGDVFSHYFGSPPKLLVPPPLDCDVFPALRDAGFVGPDGETLAGPRSTYLSVPVNVNSVAQSFETVPFTDDRHPVFTLLAQVMSKGGGLLHREVREKGGAYGSFVKHGGGGGDPSQKGIFSLLSYYDPNTSDTLRAYHQCLASAQDGHITEDDVKEAKLSMFGSIDAPSPPSSRGLSEFGGGYTFEMRQKRRERFLNITRDEIVEAAQTFRIGEAVEGTHPGGDTSIAIVGTSNDATAFESQDGWNIVHKGME
jgi:Zn-dependent M16 (insulinase) family peptidase